MKVLLRWVSANRVMLYNAGSLVGTTAVTSVLGFAYWWVAARFFALDAVGIASALVPMMMLLGGLCVLGLNTLLITELPRHPEQAGELLMTALLIVAMAGMVVGTLFAFLAPLVSTSFEPLRTSMSNALLFAVGISLTSVTLVLDQAFIGLLRGGLQLGRNTFFALAKLLVLALAGFLLPHANGLTIYTTWTLGNALSLWVLVAWMFSHQGRRLGYRPRLSLLRKLGGAALQHHLLNLALQAPTLLLPLLVTGMLSVQANAWFYVAWMLAGFVFIVPNALTTVLHAMNAAQTTTLAQKARATMSIAFLVSLCATIALSLTTKQVLGLFGGSYAQQAAQCLRILLLASFPLIIKNHYISICRIQDRIARAMLAMTPGGLLELAAAAIGAHFAGLTGLSIGWVGAISVESLFMLRTIYSAIRNVEAMPLDEEALSAIEDPIWLVDTLSLSTLIPDSMGIVPHSTHTTRSQRSARHRLQSLKPPRLEAYEVQGDREGAPRQYHVSSQPPASIVGAHPRGRPGDHSETNAAHRHSTYKE